MPNKLNLAGTETPYFKVISPAPNRGKRTYWNCICKRCGASCVISTDSIRGKGTKSCGCLKKDQLAERNHHNYTDLTGQRFGRLTVLKYEGSLRQHSAWLCKCDCGNTIITDSGSLWAGYRTSCGCQRTSIGAQLIEDILKRYNIVYQKEYNFSDLKSRTGSLLYFDFAIFNGNNQLDRLVEYDGEQHFSSKGDLVYFSDTLEQRQENDALKNEYCKKHNIKLIRIPYTEKNNITYERIFQ